MSNAITTKLHERCQGLCELCTAAPAAAAYTVSPENNGVPENEVALCNTCLAALEGTAHAAHWAGSLWNTEASVQALSCRILHRYKQQDWAADILNSVELDEAVTNRALSAFTIQETHHGSNGTELENGDNVLLTQALHVKGASFMAPKGYHGAKNKAGTR
jgi:protein PhnA